MSNTVFKDFRLVFLKIFSKWVPLGGEEGLAIQKRACVSYVFFSTFLIEALIIWLDVRKENNLRNRDIEQAKKYAGKKGYLSII